MSTVVIILMYFYQFTLSVEIWNKMAAWMHVIKVKVIKIVDHANQKYECIP